MSVKCTNCGGDHPKWECKRPATKSAGEPVAKKVVNNTHGTKPLSTMGANPTTDRPVEAGSLPVDTNSGDNRHAQRLGNPEEGSTHKDGTAGPKNPQVYNSASTAEPSPSPSIQKPKRGRPVTKNFNKAEFNRQYMRKKRARVKAEKLKAKGKSDAPS